VEPTILTDNGEVMEREGKNVCVAKPADDSRKLNAPLFLCLAIFSLNSININGT